MLKLRSKLGEWQRRLSGISQKATSPPLSPPVEPILEVVEETKVETVIEEQVEQVVDQQVLEPEVIPTVTKVDKKAEVVEEPVDDRVYVTKDTLISRGLNPFAEKVRIAYAFKCVDLEVIILDSNDQDPSWFHTASPKGQYPVMEYPNGSYSNDVEKIISRLQKDHPVPTLYPGNFADCHRCLIYLNREFFPAFDKALYENSQEHREQLEAAVTEIVHTLENHSSGPYLLGDDFSIVDVVLAPFLRRLGLIPGLKIDERVLGKYLQKLEETPCVAEVVCPIEKVKRYHATD
ncbi:hypothetical protein HDU79_010672 [Rhizoclosmatium sp. JEL0117]|nr:hypothetical protein HDU79_010672 [Rhizoclosmatium sp. JEL0117]